MFFERQIYVQDIVPWRKSRTILYWRLRRLILQDKIISELVNANPRYEDGQGEAMLRRWFIEDKGASEVSLSCYFWGIPYLTRQFQGYRWDNNEAVVQWLEEQHKKPAGHSIVQYNLHCVKKDSVLNQIKQSLEVIFVLALLFIKTYHSWLDFGYYELRLFQGCPDAALDAVVEIVHRLNDNQKAEVIRSLSLLGSADNVE